MAVTLRLYGFLFLAAFLLHRVLKKQDCKSSPFFDHPDVASHAVKTPPQDRRARAGDGCYHVFIDVGANVGVHGRFLYEPDKYSESERAVAFFEKQYGANRNNEDYCVFEIEANPNHWPRLEEISSAYKAVGWRYHVMKSAAYDSDGEAEFFHQGDGGKNEWGFAIKQIVATKELRPNEIGSVKVPTIRLSRWIQQEIFEREIPTKDSSVKPIVGLKMDIEGSEFVVLPDLFLTGVFCQLNFIFGETHQVNAPFAFDDHTVEKSDALSLLDAIPVFIRSARKCFTDLLFLDDETYLFDGIPLPSPK